MTEPRKVSAEEARRVLRTPYFTGAPDRRDLAHTVVEQDEAIRSMFRVQLDEDRQMIANAIPIRTARAEEQLAAVRALHSGRHLCVSPAADDSRWVGAHEHDDENPCPTAQALGVGQQEHE